MVSNIVVLTIYWPFLYPMDRVRPIQQDWERWAYTAVGLHSVPQFAFFVNAWCSKSVVMRDKDHRKFLLVSVCYFCYHFTGYVLLDGFTLYWFLDYF